MKAGPPPQGAAARRLRRLLGGVGLTLAFVPLGWVGSAALLGEGDRIGLGADAKAAKVARFNGVDLLTKPVKHSSLAAHVKGDAVRVFKVPGSKRKSRRLEARVLEGRTLPLVMLVEDRRAEWVKVQLPERPNGSTGWVREDDVRLRLNAWRVRIDLSAFRISTYRGPRLISTHTIGVGKSVTPTPRGRYYLTDLIQPDNPNGLYGTYAFGLSAHSDVVTSFGTGNGQIGIHGTNDPSTLQTNVSSGCIRVGNSVIESFARHFPLGTPVRIVS